MNSGKFQAIFMLYVFILFVEMLATGDLTLGNNLETGANPFVASSVAMLTHPDIFGVTNITNYAQLLFNVAFLWSPSVFASTFMLWVWWIICFPISCVTVFSIAIAIWGVISSLVSSVATTLGGIFART